MDKVWFLWITVYLQANFLVGVFQLGRWDQVIPLNVGQVVHSLCVSPLPLGLPVDVPQSQAHHTQQHEQRHQPHSQRNSRPLEAILNLPHLRGHSGKELAGRPGEARRADTGRAGIAWPGAPRAKTPIEAGMKGALVQDSVTVASTITCRTDAAVVVDSVLAGASVDARVTGTLIDVDLAALAGKSCAAAAYTHAAMDQAQTTYRRGDEDS